MPRTNDHFHTGGKNIRFMPTKVSFELDLTKILSFDTSKDKLEDMDVSLKMSASLRGPTLQI